jgi:hypothetical protein
MRAFLAILLAILLGVGLGVGIAKLRLRNAQWTPPPDSREKTTSISADAGKLVALRFSKVSTAGVCEG